MEIYGQQQASGLLERLLNKNAPGRTIILTGEKGTGKFTLAVQLAEKALNKNPFISSDFIFYRNDDFSLKTRFFLQNRDNEKIKKLSNPYFFYLMGRLSSAIAYGETGKSSLKLKKIKKGPESYSTADFRNDLEEILLNNRVPEVLETNTPFAENLISVSDELTKKKRIPIDFIRNLIAFNSQKPSGNLRLSIIANFENATDEAQNSSLKLFEEPSETSMIILTADSIRNILPDHYLQKHYYPYE